MSRVKSQNLVPFCNPCCLPPECFLAWDNKKNKKQRWSCPRREGLKILQLWRVTRLHRRRHITRTCIPYGTTRSDHHPHSSYRRAPPGTHQSLSLLQHALVFIPPLSPTERPTKQSKGERRGATCTPRSGERRGG